MAVPERWRLCFIETQAAAHVYFGGCSCVGMSCFGVTAASKCQRAPPLPPCRGPRVRPALCRNRLPFPTGLLTFEDGSEVVAGHAGHLFGCGGGWNVGRDGRGRNSGVSPVLWSFGADDTSVSPWMNLRSNAFCSPLSPPLTQGPVTACARGQQRGPVRLFCVWNPVSLSSLD